MSADGKGFPAQVSALPAEPSQVEAYRAMPKRSLYCHINALQCHFGREFDWETMGEILSRATDEEIRRLHKRKPRPW